MRRALAAHIGSREVARVIYGTIIGLALVVAMQLHPPSAGQAALALVGTAVAVGLAEVYSDLVGEEARTRRRVDAQQVRAKVRAAGAVTLGAGFPAVFFLLAALGVFDVELAFNLSKWTGLGLLFAYGFVAGRLAGWGRGGSLLHATAVGVVGGALIGLKALMH